MRKLKRLQLVVSNIVVLVQSKKGKRRHVDKQLPHPSWVETKSTINYRKTLEEILSSPNNKQPLTTFSLLIAVSLCTLSSNHNLMTSSRSMRKEQVLVDEWTPCINQDGGARQQREQCPKSREDEDLLVASLSDWKNALQLLSGSRLKTS